MSLVVDYIKSSIRNRIEMKQTVTQDGKLVRSEASENLLQDIPIYVRQAVIDLQRDNLLPPKQIIFNTIDKKEEKRNASGELRYNYFQLPGDFRELHEFEVDGEHYKSDSGHVYFQYRFERDSVKRYTIVNVDTDPDKIATPQLIFYPVPDDDDEVTLRYYIDGSETSLGSIDDRYYTAILKKVEQYLNLTDSVSAQAEINEIASQNMNQKGVNKFNNNTRVVPNYFGRR